MIIIHYKLISLLFNEYIFGRLKKIVLNHNVSNQSQSQNLIYTKDITEIY